MVLPHGYGDFYHKYRPLRFEEMAGHKQIISSIRKAVLAKYPSQAYLLTGESGTGKTSTARIMALSLNCIKGSKEGEPCLECSACKLILSGKATDIIEVNAADHRGIGDIRTLCHTMGLMPYPLKNKVYILDEAHQLTNDAQSSLLKELEEAPKHVYIILCSTHPQKILPTVKNRCQKFKFGSLRRAEMLSLVEEVATLEGEDLPNRVYEAITDASGGSPRQALVLLQQVVQLGSTSLPDILGLIDNGEGEEPNVFKICFELNKQGNPSWTTIVKLYKEAIHLGAPGIGMMVAGFFRGQLLKAKTPVQAANTAKILELFITPFPPGKLGENILVLHLFTAFELRGGLTSNTPVSRGYSKPPRFKSS